MDGELRILSDEVFSWLGRWFNHELLETVVINRWGERVCKFTGATKAYVFDPDITYQTVRNFLDAAAIAVGQIPGAPCLNIEIKLPGPDCFRVAAILSQGCQYEKGEVGPQPAVVVTRFRPESERKHNAWRHHQALWDAIRHRLSDEDMLDIVEAARRGGNIGVFSPQDKVRTRFLERLVAIHHDRNPDFRWVQVANPYARLQVPHRDHLHVLINLRDRTLDGLSCSQILAFIRASRPDGVIIPTLSRELSPLVGEIVDCGIQVIFGCSAIELESGARFMIAACAAERESAEYETIAAQIDRAAQRAVFISEHSDSNCTLENHIPGITMPALSSAMSRENFNQSRAIWR